MPRPRPLSNVSSAVHANFTDQNVLTPRTPRSHFQTLHSAEHQYDVVDLGDGSRLRGDQTVPLLVEERETRKFTSKFHRIRSSSRSIDIPLILGVLSACFLFGLLVISYRHPGSLQVYFGVQAPQQSQDADIELPSEVPLHPSEYVAQCRALNRGFMAHGDYWDKPLMDMASYNTTEDAEDIGKNEGGGAAICSKTITYLLDGEVGLLADLALIAQAAALARERNRTFIIDDTYWNRGKWMDYFQDSLDLQPGPEPGCLPPRPKDLVACPRIARHWVITAHTSRYHFGHAFAEHYENAYGRNLNRLRPIYDAARESLASAIQPNANLDTLIRSARHEFRNFTHSDDPYLSVHIRRGDRKLRFSGPDVLYVPTTEYVIATKATQDRLPILHRDDAPIYFASDSPTAELEFANAYAGRFFSLRQSASSELGQLASSSDYDQKEFNKLSDEERVRLTKGMVVDFALLSGAWTKQGDPAPRASVCTKSSNVCKMIAVGLGWNNAFGEVDETGDTDEDRKGWVEIEEKGTIVPVWTAFELF